MHIVIVTGLSGAGKSQALHTLEDQGYFCVDNLPVELIEPLFQTPRILKQQKIAIGIDVRCGKKCISKLPEFVRKLKPLYKIDIVYLYASNRVLIKRYDVTRRKHPLSSAETTLQQSIEKEAELLSPLRIISDLQIDTSQKDIYELASIVKNRVCIMADYQISLTFQSFGFKYGSPHDSDFMFDVRCLPNPYWEPSLRSKSGKEPEVQQWLANHSDVQEMQQYLIDFLRRWVPLFVENQRAYLTISIGCTGGHHRSVYLVEKLSEYFQDYKGSAIITSHRELEKN